MGKSDFFDRHTDGGMKLRTVLWFIGEPIVQFLMIGLVIWLIATWFDPDERRYQIRIDGTQAARIAEGYARQFGQPPSPQQLRGLIDRYVADEIAYREGIAMGLHEDDEIVRRRIVQKYSFLFSDQNVPAQPSDAALARWYNMHKAQYRESGRTSFTHIYFSPDQHGAEAARHRAQVLLTKLDEDALAADYGDPFPGPAEANSLTPVEIVRIFGNSAMAETLPKLPAGRWAGPYPSGYGWHLVRVTGHTSPVSPPLAQIRDRVRADYLNAERARLDEAGAARLRKRYIVRYLGRPL